MEESRNVIDAKQIIRNAKQTGLTSSLAVGGGVLGLNASGGLIMLYTLS